MTLSIFLRLCLVSGVSWLMGCAGTQSGFWPKGSVPPGISRQVASRVDSLAEHLFVPLKNEKQAQQFSREGQQSYAKSDSLWPVWDALQPKRAKPEAQAKIDSTAKAATPAVVAPQPQTESRNGAASTSSSKIRIDAIFNLKQAREKLELSFRLDPFKPITQHYLGLTYRLFSERFPHEVAPERAADMWRRLALLEPGEYEHALNLSNVYFATGQWTKALTNFQLAENILRVSAEVSRARVDNPALAESAWINREHLFASVYYQAQCIIKRVISEKRKGEEAEADSALAYLAKARAMTEDEKWHRFIAADVKYITWDKNNIWGSALRDSAGHLAERGEFTQAANIYDQLLNQILETPRARNDAKWDYAMIEYTRLKRRASAINRLGEVIAEIPKDAAGAPQDTTYNKMFDDYGAMCFYVGLDTMRVNRKVAYEYFERAVAFLWKEQGKCFLRMAELTKANIDLSLQHAEKAVAHEPSFNRDEKKLLYDLLAQAYRRKGSGEKARFYFAKFRELQ